jgi:hypothetical protein
MEGKAEQARRDLLKSQYGYSGSKEKDTIQEANQRVQWMELEMEKMREQIKLLTRGKEGSHGTEYLSELMKSRKEEQERMQTDEANKKDKGSVLGTMSKQEGDEAAARVGVRSDTMTGEGSRVEAEREAGAGTKKGEESGTVTDRGVRIDTRRSEGSGAAGAVVEDGAGTKRNNGGKTNNQEKGTGTTGLNQE